MDEATLNKLEKILEIAQEDTVRPSDIKKFLELVLEVITQSSKEFDSISDKNQKKIDQALVDIENWSTNELRGLFEEIRGIMPKNGEDYVLTSQDKEEIASLITVPVVEKIIQHTETIKETPSKETPDEVVDKINKSNKLVKKERVEGLVDLIKNIAHGALSSLPITTSFFNGLRGKNLTIDGAEAHLEGDTVHVNVNTSGSGHTIQDEGISLPSRGSLNFVGAGVTATDDSGNNATVVTIPSSALNKETPVGTVDDANMTFTVSNEPFFLNINGLIYEEGDGIYVSYVAGTITLNTPVGTGGFIKSYH